MVEKNKSEALAAALEAVDAEMAEKPELALMRAKARGLMAGYHARWSDQKYRTTVRADGSPAIEDVITADLYNPTTGHKSRTFTLAGKIDVRAELDGETVLVDHKTTSEDITDPDATFWRQLIVESQLSHYLLLEWLNGRKADKAMWDVIRKPQISPRQLNKTDRSEITFSKTWFGWPLIGHEIEEAILTGRETLSLYEKRLVYDCTTERPERYFQRRTIPRLDAEILEYAGEVWDHSQDIIVARRTGRHPRNSGACMRWGTPCRFLGVCSGHDDFDSDKWVKKAWVHSELPVLSEKSGSEILTNSRIRTWQSCRREHLNQYERGYEKIQLEDSDSLLFGNLLHKALAAWWRCFIPQKEEDDGYHNNGAPVSAVGLAAS